MGPAEAPIARIRGQHRMLILIKSREVNRIRQLIRTVMDRFSKGTETIVIDVDPVEIL